jgi:hypothetical protein
MPQPDTHKSQEIPLQQLPLQKPGQEVTNECGKTAIIGNLNQQASPSLQKNKRGNVRIT